MFLNIPILIKYFGVFQLIGSSLLFVHDTTKACVWLIDFGKTVPAPNGLAIDHKSPWEVGNHEDGYLIGVQNLINIFSDVAADLTTATSPSEFQKTRKSSHHDNRSAIVKDNETHSSIRLDNTKHICELNVTSTESKPDLSKNENITNDTESSKFS